MKIANGKVFSWTAVFVGALVGLGLNFLLNLLSLAIGISIFSQQNADKISISIIGVIGFMLVAVTAMFITGWIAGKLSIISSVRKRWGCLYGFTAWCMSFIMTVLLLMNAIQFTQFHSNFTSKNLTAIKISNQASPMLTESAGSNAETNKRIIALNAYVTFFFFLVGACSSTAGGYIGFRVTKGEKYIL